MLVAEVLAEEAVACIKSGDVVHVTGICGAPYALVQALVDRAHELEDVKVCFANPFGPEIDALVAPEMEGHIRAVTYFIGPQSVRRAIHEGRADFIPVNLNRAPLLFDDTGHWQPDVTLVQLSEANDDGKHSFGIDTGLAIAPTLAAKWKVIAQVNPNMPFFEGNASKIKTGQIDFIVQDNSPLRFLPTKKENDDEVDKIGIHIAELIPDGATLQMGLGTIPDAALRYLHDRRSLSIYTELFGDGVMHLDKAGAISRNRNIVTGLVLGSTDEFYDWVRENSNRIKIHPTDVINDHDNIWGNKKMRAINGALFVDLTGQVCADSIPPCEDVPYSRIYSGAGGQLNFVIGASEAYQGMAIIALPSTYTNKSGNSTSRIVDVLPEGCGVTTPRSCEFVVVTEYGVADLRGRTFRERVSALTEIAHPDFRDSLTDQAKFRGLI